MRELRNLGDEAVLVVAEGPAGREKIQGRWCIGADGASSAVRKALGVAFDGVTNRLSFFVADALDATGLVPGAINMRIHGDDFVLGFPMGERGHFRILGLAGAPDTVPIADLEQMIQGRLERGFGIRYSKSAWFSRYRAHHRLAEHFRVGPTFLIGDAAHVHSPVGAQGMNTGLQDAHNLALKLADVICGQAAPSSLERYELERQPVAAMLVKTTDAAFVRLTSRSHLARFIRDRVVPVIAPLALPIMPRLIGGERLFGYLSQTRIRYRMPISGERDAAVGRRLPWSGDNYPALRSLSWQVHAYGAEATAAAKVAGAMGVNHFSFDSDPHQRLSPTRLYLVRPDGFVAAAARPEDAVETFQAAKDALTA